MQVHTHLVARQGQVLKSTRRNKDMKQEQLMNSSLCAHEMVAQHCSQPKPHQPKTKPAGKHLYYNALFAVNEPCEAQQETKTKKITANVTYWNRWYLHNKNENFPYENQSFTQSGLKKKTCVLAKIKNTQIEISDAHFKIRVLDSRFDCNSNFKTRQNSSVRSDGH